MKIPQSTREYEIKRWNHIVSVTSIALSTSTFLSLLPVPQVSATQGPTRPPSSDETKQAVLEIKNALDGMNLAESYAKQSEWQKIGDLLSTSPYIQFEVNANILVRSDGLTADDKKSLGTIKRYGTVADTIIMLGGLSGELKAGGIKIVEGTKLQQSIEGDEDDNDDDDDEKSIVQVNPSEVMKYIKLAKGSLNDVMSIATKLL